MRDAAGGDPGARGEGRRGRRRRRGCRPPRPIPQANVFREDDGRAEREPRRGARATPRRTVPGTGSVCRRSPRQARDGALRPAGFRALETLRGGDVSAPSARGVVFDRRRGPRRPGPRLPHADAAGRAGTRRRARRLPRDRGAADRRGRHPARAEGRAHHERHPDDLRLARSSRVRAAVRLRPPGRGCRARAACSSARRTATSSRWAPRTRTRRSAPCTIRGISSTFPAAPAAARRPPSRRGMCRLGARHRHGRLRPSACLAQPARRAEAHLRADQQVRPDRVRVVARHDRNVHAHRARRRDAARR